jgi:hypothetical protein
MEQLSTPTNPITVCSAAAVAGATATTYTNRMLQLVSIVKPSVILHSAWGVNTVSGNINQGGLDSMWFNVARVREAADTYQSTVIFSTGSPTNQAYYNWDTTEEALRLGFVAAINDIAAQRTGVFAMDTTIAWTGEHSPISGQFEYVAGYTVDGLHPTNYICQVPLFTQVLADADV